MCLRVGLRLLCEVAPGSFAETKPVGSGHACTMVSALFCQQRLPLVPKLVGGLHQPRAAGESGWGLTCQPVPLGVNRAVRTSYSPAFPHPFPKTCCLDVSFVRNPTRKAFGEKGPLTSENVR